MTKRVKKIRGGGGGGGGGGAENISHFLLVQPWEIKEESNTFFDHPRSSDGHNSLGQELKFIV